VVVADSSLNTTEVLPFLFSAPRRITSFVLPHLHLLTLSLPPTKEELPGDVAQESSCLLACIRSQHRKRKKKKNSHFSV
jgi:hypothetical protein